MTIAERTFQTKAHFAKITCFNLLKDFCLKTSDCLLSPTKYVSGVILPKYNNGGKQHCSHLPHSAYYSVFDSSECSLLSY